MCVAQTNIDDSDDYRREWSKLQHQAMQRLESGQRLDESGLEEKAG